MEVNGAKVAVVLQDIFLSVQQKKETHFWVEYSLMPLNMNHRLKLKLGQVNIFKNNWPKCIKIENHNKPLKLFIG